MSPDPEGSQEKSCPGTPASSTEDAAPVEVGPTEVPSVDEGLNAAVARCAEAGPSFFAGVNQTVQALAPAYALLILMLVGGDPVIEAVVSRPEFPKGERAPRRDNPALIAVLLAAKPETGPQRTWCYEWALMLIAAADAGIAPENFGDWAAGVTLKECKAEVRKRRREEKARAKTASDNDTAAEDLTPGQDVEHGGNEPVEGQPAIDPPEVPVEAPDTAKLTLEVRLMKGAELLASAALRLPEADTAELCNVVVDGSQAGDAAPVLRALLGLIEAADAPEGLADAEITSDCAGVGPDEAATAASAPAAVVSIAQSAADPGSAGRTATVADTPSGGGMSGTGVAHDDFPDLPEFLRRTPSTPLCMRPTGGSPAQSEADALTGECPEVSAPPSSSPATQTERANSEAQGDHAQDDLSDSRIPVRAPARGRRDRQP